LGDREGACLIQFEEGSRLTRINDYCLTRCLLKSICLPSSVEVIGQHCFEKSHIGSLTFAKAS
jgi:hypothetical protein